MWENRPGQNKQKKEMQKNIDLHNNAIRKLKGVIYSLEELKRSLQKHQTVVKVSKGTTAVVGVVGAGLLFSPAFPVALSGMICGGVAGIAGLATSAGDWWKTRKTRKQIEKKAEEAELKLKKLIEESEKMQKNLKIVGKVVNGAGNVVSAASKANSVAQTGIKFVGTAEDMAVGAKIAKLINPTSQAAKLRPGAELAVKTAGTVGKVFGAVGAGIGVLDALYTAVRNNPSIELAEKTIEALNLLIEELRNRVEEMNKVMNNL